ncbi:hypothetical protein AWQ21_10250 [Picosynechococcus sp. PCC 7003]|nr:hypothetical protein AWQ21_10250 [Picosynechococcus sp. PCC 7003]
MGSSQADTDYFAYWQREKQRRAAIAQQLQQQARAMLPELVSILVTQFQVTRIILFGSLVRGNFDEQSDLDLAVAGLAPQDFFRAYAMVNDHSPFPVDLKPLEAVDDSFRAKVERMGECLYESNHTSGDRRDYH